MDIRGHTTEDTFAGLSVTNGGIDVISISM